MPIYEYMCEKGHRTELLRGMWQMNEPVICATCGAHTERVISAANFVLKGSGFYRNDYPKGHK